MAIRILIGTTGKLSFRLRGKKGTNLREFDGLITFSLQEEEY